MRKKDNVVLTHTSITFKLSFRHITFTSTKPMGNKYLDECPSRYSSRKYYLNFNLADHFYIFDNLTSNSEINLEIVLSGITAPQAFSWPPPLPPNFDERLFTILPR